MKYYLTFILILVSSVSFSQGKYNANWYFGDKAAVKFTDTGIINITTSEMPAIEGCTTMSDSLGNLLFYTNGHRVWNKNNQIMSNGDTLYTNPIGNLQITNLNTYGSTSTNGVIVIPSSVYKNKYLLFTQWGSCGCTSTNSQGQQLGAIGYSVIDMSLNNGLGGIDPNKKNIVIDTSARFTEKLTAIKHGNGRDWWLIAHQSDSNIFSIYLIANDSIIGPFLQSIGGNDNQSKGLLGEITSSQQGERIAKVNFYGAVEVFDFDRCTGELSNNIYLEYPNYNQQFVSNSLFYYGCEFSPSGNILYALNADSLVQYDLSDESSIVRKSILKNPLPYNHLNSMDTTYEAGQMQLGINGKIYFKFRPGWSNYLNLQNSDMTSLSVINNPDTPGLGCNVEMNVVSHYPRVGWLSLPNLPNYNLGRLYKSSCDTLYSGVEEIDKERKISIYPNPAHNTLNIEILNGTKPNSIKLFDITGREAIKTEQTKPVQAINISALSSGIYFIEIQYQNGSAERKKFVKE